jgi:hypothetical protein
VQFVEAIGNIIGVAIDNARLFSATEQNPKRMHVARIDQAITSTLIAEPFGLVAGKSVAACPLRLLRSSSLIPKPGAQRLAYCNLTRPNGNLPMKSKRQDREFRAPAEDPVKD